MQKKLFINYFNDFGRQWQVYVEAEADYRSNADNLDVLQIANEDKWTDENRSE